MRKECVERYIDNEETKIEPGFENTDELEPDNEQNDSDEISMEDAISIDNHLKHYLGQLKYADVLGSTEQIRLIKLYKETGDRDYRNKVVSCNLRLVVSLCKSHFKKNLFIDPMELVVVGNEALIIAVEKFNCNSGVKFATYAGAVIKDRIHMFLNSGNNSINMSKESYRIKYKINQIYNEFEIQGKRAPSYGEIANMLIERDMLSADTISEELVKIIVEHGQTKSLNEYVSEGSNNVELGDTLIDDTELPFDIQIDNKLFIKKLMGYLTAREAEVITMKYMRNMGLKDISKALGVEVSTVIGAEIRGLKRMRQSIDGQIYMMERY